MDIKLFETSAKDNKNVEKMFLSITEQVLKHKKQQQRNQSDDNNDNKIHLNRSNAKKKRSCC